MSKYKFSLPIILRSPVVVVSHDAGAANLIFAWLRDWARLGLLDQLDFRFVLRGPAQVAWHSQEIPLPKLEIHTELSDALSDAHCVMTGTGWASNLEHEARKLAISLNIPCIAVIDHWVNYEQRFKRNGEVILPNVIWVSDPYAAEITKTLFKNLSVTELPNTYLNEMVKIIPPVPVDCQTLLYVLEPLRTDWGKKRAGEFQALDYFVRKKELIIGNLAVNLILRPHPSEDPNKYSDWMSDHADLQPKLDRCIKLNESIANAKWVVGAETFALVIALSAKRITWSSLPPWGHICRLPHRELKHLKDLD